MNSHRTHWQDDLCHKLDVHHFLIATSLLTMVLNLTEVFWSDYCSMALCRVFRQMIHEIYTHTHAHTHTLYFISYTSFHTMHNRSANLPDSTQHLYTVFGRVESLSVEGEWGWMEAALHCLDLNMASTSGFWRISTEYLRHPTVTLNLKPVRSY